MHANLIRFCRAILISTSFVLGCGAIARAQAPGITTQPVSVVVAPGNPVNFSVVASGATPLSYQWKKDGNVISVATGPNLSILAAVAADAGVYTVSVTNPVGTATSNAVTLTVLLSPQISTQPVSQTATPGGALTLQVVATGSGALAYQWFRNGGVIAGATNASYPIPAASVTDVGAYTVQVSNSVGQVTSIPARVVMSGALWTMGRNANAASDASAPLRSSLVQVVANGVASVVAGSAHKFFLKTDGSLWGVGRNDRGQLGDGTTINRTSPVLIANGVKAVTTYDAHSLFVKTNGSLWAMGDNQFGQLGDGTTTNRIAPVQVATEVILAAAGGAHSLYVRADGSLWAMGNNQHGQLGDDTTISRSKPIQVGIEVSAVAAGESHSLYLANGGTLWAMGDNNFGQLGDGTTTDRPWPVQLAQGVLAVAARARSSFILKFDGTLLAMGFNGFGQLGDGTTLSRSSPVRVAANVTSMAAGESHSFYIKADESLWGFGDNQFGQLGDGTTFSRLLPVQVAVNVSMAAAGDGHSSHVKTDGSLWAVGENSFGQIGVGRTTTRLLPLLVATGVSTATAGDSHGLIVKTDGSLWATGENGLGQLGDGTTLNRASPVQVATGVAAAATGLSHSLFIKTDGSLWAMGSNVSGQLGDGTTINRSFPVQVATGVSAVVARSSHSLFIKTDGTLWAMGANTAGQLGDGTTTNRSSPVQVATGVSAVAAGLSHSSYLKTDGSLWMAGSNQFGQLGTGTTTNAASPVQVASGVLAVAAGDAHSLFVKTDGTLWAMGSNSSGQLGDGTAITRTSPVQVASGVTSVTAGDAHSLFGTTDGALWAMGSNQFGQLGDGTTVSRISPVQVATGVTGVAAGAARTSYTQISGLGIAPRISALSGGGSFAPGASVLLSVATVGSGPLDFQWQKNGVSVAGARSPTFAIPALAAADAGSYTVIITNSVGSVTSSPMAVTLNVPPTIVVQPAAVVVNTGSAASFSVTAAGSVPLIYQWYKNGIAISGATNATHTIGAAVSGDVGSYLVTVTNSFDTVTSASATLSVNPVVGPAIGTQPSSVSAIAGTAATLSVVATGTAPFTYQWRKDGVPIAGATNAVLTLSGVQKSDAGTYTVSVFNNSGSVTSSAATLSVAAYDPGRIINVSILAQLAAGETMTLGAVLGGAGTDGGKPLLVRAAGPSLAPFGILALLADPTLNLFSEQTVVATNDNWSGAADLSNAFARVGAFPYAAATSRDAAVFSPTLFAGNYTVRISGVGGAGGRVLAELYDATAAEAFAVTTPRLVNVSVLKNINAGEVLAAGFVIGGTTPKTVLIRAIGPPLAAAPFNVPGAMVDPILRLFSGSTVISVNDDWGAGALASALAAAFTRVGAFELRADSADAALLVTLPPGNYTAHVSGPGGGVALVEVYEVP